MKKVLTIIAVLVATLNVSAQQKAITYKTYVDKKKGYQIKYPSNWVNKDMQGAEFFIARPVEEVGQIFMENINMVKGEAEDLYLVEYVMDAERKMQRDMRDFKPIKGRYVKIGELDAYQMFYTYSYNDKYHMHNVLYIILKDGKAYSITGSALESTFTRFYPIFETMAQSLRITGPVKVAK
jgi:hypothetical protein